MKKIVLRFIAVIITVAVTAVAAGKVSLYFSFVSEVRRLFSQSADITDKKFSYSQLTTLPEPVRRYFIHVLKDGQPYISYVRLKHTGYFRPDPGKGFVDIKGEQYFTTDTPGFIWKGDTSLFTARDMYISGRGSLIVTLFSLVKIVNGSGPDYDHGELLRWLGESILFPTNLLPSDRLKWTPVDSRTAGLTFNYKGLSLYYKVSFNDRFEIVELETKRSMGENRIETWIGRASNYRDINGVMVPSKIEAVWRLKDGDLPYGEFHIREIEYGKNQRFK